MYNELKPKFHEVYDIAPVMDFQCNKYGIQYNKVDQRGAESALNQNRFVLASFWISDKCWTKFSKFFRSNPKGTLTEKLDGDGVGHTVVITGHSAGAWYVKNSWGSSFANEGYFKVKKGSLELVLVDVFWTLEDVKKMGLYKRTLSDGESSTAKRM